MIVFAEQYIIGDGGSVGFHFYNNSCRLNFPLDPYEHIIIRKKCCAVKKIKGR